MTSPHRGRLERDGRQARPSGRDAEGLTLANRITIARMLMIPPFVIALLQGAYRLALLVGLVVFVSDALDGWVARRYRQRTRLGSFLDPLADKLLLISTYAALTHRGDVPEWLLVVIVSKDVTVSLGWGLMFILERSSEIVTLLSGKAATAAQMVFALLVLLTRAAPLESPVWLVMMELFKWLTVALTVLSLLDYLRLGSRRLAHNGL